MLKFAPVAQLKCLPGLLALMVLLLPLTAYTQVYQWKDADGNVHFGDAPPGGVDAKSVALPSGPSAEEVESAQRELQDTLNARAAEDAAVAQPAAARAAPDSNQSVPEFACYTPIEEVLRGPTRAAYVPGSPTDLSDAQRRGARSILAAANGQWRGSAIELNCSGQIDSPKSENFHFDVSSTGSWKGDRGLLILENRAKGSRRRVNEVRVSYIQIDAAVYFFEAKGDGNQTVDRTVALPGNKSEGLYLDQTSLAFMSRRRSYHVMRTEIRHLKVKARSLEYTELYFHSNLLTGSRVWSLAR